MYDLKGISNRGAKREPLSFSQLSPMDTNDILATMKKEASALSSEMTKEATVLSNPFEAFGHAKYYISSKLGLGDETAHDLASSVVGKAMELQELHGGELGQMITGIVDHMPADQVQARVGALPRRKMSTSEIEEMIKVLLIEQMQMSAYQADQFKKIVLTQARNLSTQFREYDLEQLSKAVVSVLVDHQDASIAYGLSSTDRLREEVKYHLEGGDGSGGSNPQF